MNEFAFVRVCVYKDINYEKASFKINQTIANKIIFQTIDYSEGGSLFAENLFNCIYPVLHWLSFFPMTDYCAIAF